jgi:ABC-type branched-subunit amino acid transport system substrate-binding protein
MTRDVRILLGSLLGIATACSLTLVDRKDCVADEDCVSTFGSGWSCGADGLCTAPLSPDEIDDCDVAVCDRVINIGNVSAQTGPTSNLGLEMVAGIRAAFKEANDAGGVGGRQLNLIVRDDGYEPDNTEPEMKMLTRGGDDREVLAIVGNVGTPPAAVALPIAKDADVVFHGAFTGAGLLREDPPARVVFNYRASYAQETAALVQYFVEFRDLDDRVPPENIGVFAQGESAAADDATAFDGYGASGFGGVAEALRGVVAEDDVPKASYERNTSNVDVATDYFVRWLAGPSSVVSEDGVVRASVVMVPTADPAANFVFAMRDAIAAAKSGENPEDIELSDEERSKLATVDLLLASVSFVGSDKLRQNLTGQGNEYCAGVAVAQVVPLPFGSSSGALRYRDALEAYSDATSDVHAAGFVSFEGYLAAQLFVDGLRAAETFDTDGLVAGLESLSGLEYGIGTKLSFSVDDHQASDRVFGTQLDADCEFENLELGAAE